METKTLPERDRAKQKFLDVEGTKRELIAKLHELEGMVGYYQAREFVTKEWIDLAF